MNNSKINLILEAVSNNEKQMAADADKAFKEVLKSMSIKPDELHLRTYEELDRVRKALEKKLREYGVDFSFKDAVTPSGIKISGNAGGICSSYFNEYVHKAWTVVKMTPSELEDYLRKNKKIKIYQDSRYTGVEKEIDKEKLLKEKFGTSYSNRGMGSQSSVVQSTVELEKDAKGNLLLSKFSLVWD